MAQNTEFLVDTWTKRSNQLLQRANQLVQQLQGDPQQLPADIYDGNKPLSLVFAGQYSAGKSTILKALTGITDIDVGAGITTQKAHFYKWQGNQVVDTPGIHTTLRPDHDEISYQAIANADLLVYVVTKELFDDYIGQNFRKLLIDDKKAAEMVLVVNKMGDVGNDPEMRAIKLQDLAKVTRPFKPEDLHTVCIDAESYLESQEESDPEIKQALEERSNFDEFIATLNKFIIERGLAGRLTTGIYRLRDSLQKIMQSYLPSSGDADVDALEEHLIQEKQLYLQSQNNIEFSVQGLVAQTSEKICSLGRTLAEEIVNCSSESEAENALKQANKQVQNFIEDCQQQIQNKITQISNDCLNQIDLMKKNDFSVTLLANLTNKQNNNDPIIAKIADYSNLVGKTITTNAQGANAALSGLKAVSGSNIHKAVLEVGHFFNHTFKPWEALKYTQWLKTAGTALSVAGVVLSVVGQIYSDQKAEEQQRALRRCREDIRANFNSIASEFVEHMRTTLQSYFSQSYQEPIKQIDSQLASITHLRAQNSRTCQELSTLLQDCLNLIDEIHQACSKPRS